MYFPFYIFLASLPTHPVLLLDDFQRNPIWYAVPSNKSNYVP
jgi:hypothetical protein